MGLTSSDGTRRRQTEPRDPFRDVELADAVEHQINTLPALPSHCEASTNAQPKRDRKQTRFIETKSFAGFSRDS